MGGDIECLPRIAGTKELRIGAREGTNSITLLPMPVLSGSREEVVGGRIR